MSMIEAKDLKIMANTESTIEKQLQLLGGLSLFLAMALLEKEYHYSWEYLHRASMLGHVLDCPAFNALYDATASIVVLNKERENTEDALQKKFKAVAHCFWENAEVVEGKKSPKSIPDAWVNVDGEDIPCEVKLGVFNRKALKQLMRYMSEFDCKKGIAVAKEISVNLPDNIIFIPREIVEDAYFEVVESFEDDDEGAESVFIKGKEQAV